MHQLLLVGLLLAALVAVLSSAAPAMGGQGSAEANPAVSLLGKTHHLTDKDPLNEARRDYHAIQKRAYIVPVVRPVFTVPVVRPVYGVGYGGLGYGGVGYRGLGGGYGGYGGGYGGYGGGYRRGYLRG